MLAMTTEAPLPDLRRWAAVQLELKPNTTPEQVRAALLRRLPEDAFVPPYRCQQAALFLICPADGAERALRQGQAAYDEEGRLRIEVDAFAAEFFKLALRERRQRWQELRGRCAFSTPLTARLEGLEKGLDVALDNISATAVRELAVRICDLFVLRPVPRAMQRQELFRDMRMNAARWQAPARQLQKQAPQVAGLAPVLVQELAGWKKRWSKAVTSGAFLLVFSALIYVLIFVGSGRQAPSPPDVDPYPPIDWLLGSTMPEAKKIVDDMRPKLANTGQVGPRLLGQRPRSPSSGPLSSAKSPP
jgi:hypothetical protein